MGFRLVAVVLGGYGSLLGGCVERDVRSTNTGFWTGKRCLICFFNKRGYQVFCGSLGEVSVHVVRVKLLASVLLPPQSGRCRDASGVGKNGKWSGRRVI